MLHVNFEIDRDHLKDLVMNELSLLYRDYRTLRGAQILMISRLRNMEVSVKTI